MKTLLAAALLATSLAWTGTKTGWKDVERSSESDFYRSLGRDEARWMGSISGESPDFLSLDASAYFDWTRSLGRSEAHFTDGFLLTGQAEAADREGASESLQAGLEGCSIIDENRAKGRDEARYSRVRYGKVYIVKDADSEDRFSVIGGLSRVACQRL